LDAIDAMALDIIERDLEHYPTRLQSIAIVSNSGRSSSAVLVRTWFALAVRDFRSVGVRHPFGRGGEASELFEIYVDSSKRIRRCFWKTFTQSPARCEALSRHGRQHRRYCDMNASGEDA
jgi:hypothetical protein